MGKYYISILTIACILTGLSFTAVSHAQETVYNENFGNPGDEKKTPLDLYTDFQANAPIKYEGTVDVRNNKTSEKYEGASGYGNIYFNDGTMDFYVIGLNTEGYNDLKLSFGVWHQYQGGATEQTPVYSEFKLAYSLDGGRTWIDLSYTMPAIEEPPFTVEPGGSKDGKWALAEGITLPAATSMVLRFSKTTELVNYRVDDIKIIGTKPADLTIGTDKSQLTYEDTEVGANKAQTIKITVPGARGDVNLELANNTNYKLSTSKLTAAEAIAGKSVTVTFQPITASNSLQDYLYITTQDANKVEIPMDGRGILSKPIAKAGEQISTTSFVASWEMVEGVEKYLLSVYTIVGQGVESIILSETFTKMIAGEGLKIGDCIDANNVNFDLFMENPGWSGTMVYVGSDDDFGKISGVTRVGKKDQIGRITSPVVNLSSNSGVATVKFELRTFARMGEKDEVLVLHVVNGAVRDTIADLKNLFPEFVEYSYQITGGTTTSQIRIEGKKDKDNRFVLQNFSIVQGGPQKVYNRINKSTKLDNMFEVTELTQNTTYYYSVRAYASAIYKTAVSDEVEVKTSFDTHNEIETTTPEADKPTAITKDGYIEVTGISQGESIKLYNIVGQLEAETVSNGETNRINAKKGIYIVKAANLTQRVVVK